MQFGLDSLSELPNLKELEELSRAALGEDAEEQQPRLPGVAEKSDGGLSDTAEIEGRPDESGDEEE